MQRRSNRTPSEAFQGRSIPRRLQSPWYSVPVVFSAHRGTQGQSSCSRTVRKQLVRPTRDRCRCPRLVKTLVGGGSVHRPEPPMTGRLPHRRPMNEHAEKCCRSTSGPGVTHGVPLFKKFERFPRILRNSAKVISFAQDLPVIGRNFV